MVTLHNLGYPRIGAARELKFALEAYWAEQSSLQQLLTTGQTLRAQHWQEQSALDWVPVGDFSYYDHVLDMSFMLGNVPERFQQAHTQDMDHYFRVARGHAGHSAQGANEPAQATPCCNLSAGEMTKWFNTNYHYIVPELHAHTDFRLHSARLHSQIAEAVALGVKAKPVLIGPISYLALSKAKDGCTRLDLLERLLPVYVELLEELAAQGLEWVQMDEPILVTELDTAWRYALHLAYHRFKSIPIKLMLTTYFGELRENQHLLVDLPVAGIHVDAISGENDVEPLLNLLPSHKVLSLGIINGRNIWRTDLNRVLDGLEPIAAKRGEHLWLAPSCSLIHVPLDVTQEQALDPGIHASLAFAKQKLEELQILAQALRHGRDCVQQALQQNAQACALRQNSTLVHKTAVHAAVAASAQLSTQRQNPFAQRKKKQAAELKLPPYPTTTIGSFPQTPTIRQTRSQFKRGQMDEQTYQAQMRAEIVRCIYAQEELGLDVLVHGEAERNDMVEYFGEHLEGFVISQAGWVQSYGSRCVKPPILFGDVARPQAITVPWICYAQSLTEKPVKGMLTGPVTILNWSFVRDDQPRAQTCQQIALALRQEVLDLQAAGIRIIQIDEAALREGLPLRKSDWESYFDWAIAAYCTTANGVDDETQIHTHMCYSEFNDILPYIAQMDADVITIETARSEMELLEAFHIQDYPNDIGPGVYDIHSPNIPSSSQIMALMRKAATRIAPERLWVNPDCGLKTRRWEEVKPALLALVQAAQRLRGYDQPASIPA